VALLALALASCDGCGDKPLEQSPPEPPRPKGLLAELVLSQPHQSWRQMRALAGVGVLALPSQAAVALAPVLGIAEATAAERIVTRAPWLLVLAAQDDTLLTAAAVPLDKPKRFIDTLTGGQDAPFVAHGAQPALVSLRPAKARGGLRLAVLDSHVLAGNSDAALQQLGPYLVRSLARRMPPKGDAHLSLDSVSRTQWDKLAAPVLDRARARLPTALRNWWSTLGAAFRDEHGRIQQLEARLSLQSSAVVLRAKLETTPAKATDAPATKLQPIGGLHEDAAAGWVIATTATQRQLLGKALSQKKLAQLSVDETTASRIIKAARSLAGAVGSSVLGQLSCDGQPSTALRLSIDQRAALLGLAPELTALSKDRQLGSALEAKNLQLTIAPLPSPDIAGQQRLSLLPTGNTKTSGQYRTELLFLVEPQTVSLAVNRGALAQAQRALQQLVATSSSSAPSSGIGLGASLAKHPAKVQLGLFINPLRLLGCLGKTTTIRRSAPLLLSLAATTEGDSRQLALRLDAPAESLRALAAAAALR